jgi:glucuronosyltransferase
LRSYARNATKIARMLRARPTNSEEMVVKWTEFLAEFKTLPNLDPASKHMTLIQLYSIDTIAVIAGVLLIVLFTLYKILATCARCICGSSASSSGTQKKKSKRE